MRALHRSALGSLVALAVVACGAGSFLASSALAATITIVNIDGVGEGFNDATPAAPVGGNPGTTIGQQRFNVFQHAANIWGGILPSSVIIRVRAQFNPQTCTATTGVLGSAGPTGYWADAPGAIIPGHWYHRALANKLANADLDPGVDDINTTFNSNIGGATCLPQGWYYGLDGNEGTQIELLPVVLHELGHGLGFSTPTSGASGNYFSALPSVYDHFLYNSTTGLHWDQMTPAQRVSSATSCGALAWDGPAVMAGSAPVLGPRPLLRVNAPGAVATDYQVGLAAFGPSLSYPGITGDVVLVEDAAAPLNNGCEAITNDVNGKIALINRGTCTFTVKVLNAQNAGAIAVIVADSLAGCPPAGLGGADPSITIPAVRVTLTDGNLLKANLVGLNATLLVDPSLEAGADAAHRVFVYTPQPFASGSSISHWDTSAEPSLLMEPAITGGLSSDVDLTRHHFSDIGWIDFATPVLIGPGRSIAETGRVRVEWYSAQAQSLPWTAYRRTADTDWQAIGAPSVIGSGTLFIEDTNVEPGVHYAYRLGTIGDSGREQFSDEIWAIVPSNLVFALEGGQPNPANGPLTVSFSLASAAPARLDLVNVAGRILFSKQVGDRGPGRHVVPLDLARKLNSGVYFLRLTQNGKSLQSPVTVLR